MSRKPQDKGEVKLIKCPGCDLMLPEDDPHAQIAHMQTAHPQIIAKRLRDAGMHHEAQQWDSSED